jgi:hypothetical protein
MGLILCVLGGLAACHGRAAVRGAGYTDDYEIAVIRTDIHRYSTFIEYYDGELELVNKLEYPYASMENSWGKPMCYGNVMYVIPQGLGNSLNARLVVGLDMETGAVREYKVDLPYLKNLAVNEKYIFVSNNQNGTSKIVRVDKESGETASTEFDGLVPSLAAKGDEVIALHADWGKSLDERRILVLGEDLRLRQTVAIEECKSVGTSDLIDDRLYFGSPREDSFSETGWNYSLLYFSLEDRQICQVASSDFKFHAAAAIGGDLYVLQFDPNVDEANKIIILDKGTGAYKNEYLLNYKPQFVYCKDGALFVSGDDKNVGGWVLGKYLPEDGALIPIKEIRLERDGHFVSGLFSMA